MLKKIAYAVITSGLLLAPLGSSAMANDTPFPACYGVECMAPTHERARMDTVASASESRKPAGSRQQQIEAPSRASNSPFPFDNSKD